MKMRKLLSILFIFCILLTPYGKKTFAGDIQENDKSSQLYEGEYPENYAAEDTRQAEPLKAEEIPQIVGPEAAAEKGHIKRLYEKEQSLNSFVFKNTNGTESFYCYAYPVKFMDKNGAIRDIKLDITEDAQKTGAFITEQNSIKTEFSKKLTDGISLRQDGISIKMIPADAPAQSIAILQDVQTVFYPYGEKASLECSLTYTGFNNHIILEKYTGQTEYRFNLYTNGLKVIQKDQSYYLADETNQIKVNIGDVLVFTADEKNNTIAEMSYSIIREREEYQFTIQLDAEYLADENTVYPVALMTCFDIDYNGVIEDVTINSLRGSDGNSGSLYIGLRETYGKSRTLIRFPGIDLSHISAASQISDATIELRDLMCQSTALTLNCHAFLGNVWNESTANWSNTNPNSYSSSYTTRTISYANGTASDSWKVRKASREHFTDSISNRLWQAGKEERIPLKKGF